MIRKSFEKSIQEIERALDHQITVYSALREQVWDCFVDLYQNGDIYGCRIFLSLIEANRRALRSSLEENLHDPWIKPDLPVTVWQKAVQLNEIMDRLVREMELFLAECGRSQ